jgi:hypothetical protein
VGLVVFGVVTVALVVAVAVMARRSEPAGAPQRARVQPEGLVAVDGPAAIAWSAIESVALLTDHRRLRRRTRFAFVAHGEHGEAMVLSSRTGEGQRFLAESHRLRGFDQRLVREVLSTPRSQRRVCFRRAGPSP